MSQTESKDVNRVTREWETGNGRGKYFLKASRSDRPSTTASVAAGKRERWPHRVGSVFARSQTPMTLPKSRSRSSGGNSSTPRATETRCYVRCRPSRWVTSARFGGWRRRAGHRHSLACPGTGSHAALNCSREQFASDLRSSHNSYTKQPPYPRTQLAILSPISLRPTSRNLRKLRQNFPGSTNV